MGMTKSDERSASPGSMIRKYGILLLPVALVLAMLCFRALNSEWLLFGCAGSFVFSVASLWAVKRANGPIKHFATILLGATACLSLAAALLGLSNQG